MKDIKIAVIGLGYVGLPLARLFSTRFETIGFDLNAIRIDEINSGHDSTMEVDDGLLTDAIKNHGFRCTTNIEDLKDFNFYIVAVPTPIDENNHPDLTPLIKASETVGKVISVNDIVVYESTVYPGVTEEECIPVVEAVSGLKFNIDFFAGYSPERINPGDKLHSVEKIRKVTSGSTPEIADLIDEVYNIFSNATISAISIFGETSFIKRVIGLPGDHVEVKDNVVYLNGQRLNEPYLDAGVQTTSEGGMFTDIVVPDGYVYVLGDNRSNSGDSRRFGCVPIGKIEGKAVWRFWPLNKWKILK